MAISHKGSGDEASQSARRWQQIISTAIAQELEAGEIMDSATAIAITEGLSDALIAHVEALMQVAWSTERVRGH